MKTGFSVLQFSLETTPEGKPTQRVQDFGAYNNIEAAFAVARAKAMQEWQRSSRRDLGQETATILHIEGTEWGYDLKREHLVVSRFWVHDGQPAELGIASPS